MPADEPVLAPPPVAQPTPTPPAAICAQLPPARRQRLRARQVGGRGSPWAVWADEAELTRLRELRECPRLWANQERLARLRSPTPRP